MSFLLDTNAISEPQRENPDPGYMAWMGDRHAEELYLSVLSLGELKRGLGLLDAGRRRSRIAAWIAEAIILFGDRLLPIDAAVAEAWANVTLAHRRQGMAPGAVDELIAASAIVHDLTVVTRNARDFKHSGCRVLSPWKNR